MCLVCAQGSPVTTAGSLVQFWADGWSVVFTQATFAEEASDIAVIDVIDPAQPSLLPPLRVALAIIAHGAAGVGAGGVHGLHVHGHAV